MRVLFVCLGNICRSPTAEAVLRTMAADDWIIDSAGTGDWHIGKPPFGPAIEAAAARGYDLSPLRARQISPDDFDAFELLIVMDRQNLADIEALRPPGAETPVRLLLDYVADISRREVPDPYFSGDFEGALDLIEFGCEELVRTHSV